MPADTTCWDELDTLGAAQTDVEEATGCVCSDEHDEVAEDIEDANRVAIGVEHVRVPIWSPVECVGRPLTETVPVFAAGVSRQHPLRPSLVARRSSSSRHWARTVSGSSSAGPSRLANNSAATRTSPPCCATATATETAP